MIALFCEKNFLKKIKFSNQASQQLQLDPKLTILQNYLQLKIKKHSYPDQKQKKIPSYLLNCQNISIKYLPRFQNNNLKIIIIKVLSEILKFAKQAKSNSTSYILLINFIQKFQSSFCIIPKSQVPLQYQKVYSDKHLRKFYLNFLEQIVRRMKIDILDGGKYNGQNIYIYFQKYGFLEFSMILLFRCILHEIQINHSLSFNRVLDTNQVLVSLCSFFNINLKTWNDKFSGQKSYSIGSVYEYIWQDQKNTYFNIPSEKSLSIGEQCQYQVSKTGRYNEIGEKLMNGQKSLYILNEQYLYKQNRKSKPTTCLDEVCLKNEQKLKKIIKIGQIRRRSNTSSTGLSSSGRLQISGSKCVLGSGQFINPIKYPYIVGNQRNKNMNKCENKFYNSVYV